MAFIPPGTVVHYHRLVRISGRTELEPNPIFSTVVLFKPKSNLIIGKVVEVFSEELVKIGDEVALGSRRHGLGVCYRISKSPDQILTTGIKQVVFIAGEVV